MTLLDILDLNEISTVNVTEQIYWAAGESGSVSDLEVMRKSKFK